MSLIRMADNTEPTTPPTDTAWLWYDDAIKAFKYKDDTGTVHILSHDGPDGVVSINGNTTAAQVIAAGTGISVVSASGTTTITNTSPPTPPGGVTTTVQYNNAGAFGGIDALRWNSGTRVLTFDSFAGSPVPRFNVANAEFNIDTSGSNNLVVMDTNGTLVPSDGTQLKVSTDFARLLIGGATDNSISPLQAEGFVKIPSLEGISLTSGPTYTLAADENVLYCLATTTVTFPAITAALNGKCFTVINGDGSGSTTVTFFSATDTFSGDFTSLSTRPYEGCKFMADFANSTWRPVVTLPSDLFVGNAIVGGVPKGVCYADNNSGLALKCNTTFTWDETTLTVGEPDDHESQILFSTFAGQDGAFIGSGNGGPTTRISSPYFALCMATNPGGDGLGTGIIGVNGLASLIEWKETGELYFNGLLWPSADGGAATVLTTDGAGNLYWDTAPNPFDQSLNVADPVTFSTVTASRFLATSPGTPANNTFAINEDSGMYQSAANHISLATNSMQVFDGYVDGGNQSVSMLGFVIDGLTQTITNPGNIISSTGGLRVADGSAGAPSITFNGDTTTGFWRSGGVHTQIGGVDTLNVDATAVTFFPAATSTVIANDGSVTASLVVAPLITTTAVSATGSDPLKLQEFSTGGVEFYNGAAAVIFTVFPTGILKMSASSTIQDSTGSSSYDPNLRVFSSTTTNVLQYDGTNSATSVYWFDSADSYRMNGLGPTFTGTTTTNNILTAGLRSTAGENEFTGQIYALSLSVSSDGTSGGTLGHQFTGAAMGFYGTVPISQEAAIPDATGGVIIDQEARDAINALLAACRAYGFIAT